MDNAADRKSIRRKEKDARIASRQRGEVITSIMSTMAGRSWLWDRLSETSIFSTTYVGGDALASAFQEGRRSVGLSLLADIMAYCPDQYIQAMREADERHHSNNRDPDLDPAGDADAERPSGPISDRGDSGAEPDQAAGSEAGDADIHGWQSPGYDIYVRDETGGKA